MIMLQIEKNRKEVSLNSQTLFLLQISAEKEGRKLKNYLEHVLKEKAGQLMLSEEYKLLMDKEMEKHKNNSANYDTWENTKMKLDINL
jgi:hypothetical protein